MNRLLGTDKPLGMAIVSIAAVTGALALLFAFTAGWLSPNRITPDKMVDALGERGGDPVGHRRNHAKGICFAGDFAASGAGDKLSTAPMFVAGHYPVIGRFAIGVGDPKTPDALGRVRSMAIRIVTPDGQEWRSGINDIPFFVVRTPKAFYELTLASDIDPATGKPDPAAIKLFAAAHPEAAPFFAWAGSAPWTGSYADEAYNSIDAFIFVDGAGNRRAVRWSMLPSLAAEPVAVDQLKARGPDFLEQDVRERLGKGALGWTLVATLAAPNDPTADSTKAWSNDREQVTLGTLSVQQVQAEADGPCRDYNYDPLILPSGIEASDDPLLAARSAAYAVSFDRRTGEEAAYPPAP